MIHSPGVTPPGNLDPLDSQATPETTAPRSFRFPADYYSAPLDEVRPIFPKWVPYGCGSASAVFLVLLFAGGAFLSGSKMGEVVDLMLGMSLGEMRSMYAPDVTPAAKAHFEAETKRMRDGLRARKVPLQNVRPFLKTLQSAIRDRHVTAPELDQLTRAAREAATAPPPKTKP